MRIGKSYSEAGFLGAIKTAKIKAEQKRQRIELYDAKPNTCTKCSKPLGYEKRHNKFCRSSCAASYSNLGKAKNPIGLNGQIWKEPVDRKVQTKKEIIPCQFCNSPIKKNATKYCSLRCQADHRWNKLLSEVQKNNGFSPSDSYGRAGTIRKYLIRTRGIKCQICGAEKWNNKEIPLVVDHVDGNFTNNSLPNLRVICCNCDAQTPTYKGKNRGHGRAYRRQRYADGKSW